MAHNISQVESLTSRIWSNKIDQVVTCVICKKYNNSPMLQLDCFHVYHKECLEGAHGNAIPESTFPCSACQTPCQIPGAGIDGFPEELLQHKQGQLDKIFANGPPPCDICGNVTIGTEYCFKCKKYLCPMDQNRHNQMVGNHEMITIADTQSDEYLPRIISSTEDVCAIHSTEFNTEAMAFFCLDCQLPVCQFCKVTSHGSHAMVSKDTGRKFKEELQGKTDEIHRKQNDCEFVKGELDLILKKIEATGLQQIQECEQWWEDVQKIVNKIANDNIQNIKRTTQIQKQQVTTFIEQRRHQNKKFKSAKDYMQAFLKFGSDFDVIRKHGEYHKNLDKSLQTNTEVKIKLEKSKVEKKDVNDIELSLQGMLHVENLSEDHHIKPPTQLQQPQLLPKRLSSCEFEKKWRTDEMRTGLAVYGDEIIAVKGQKIEVFRMNGERIDEINRQEHLSAGDVEVFKKQLFVSDCNTQKREVLVIDRRGIIQRKIGLPAKEKGLGGAHLLSLGLDHERGDLYIASLKTDTIYKCPNGQDQAFPFIDHGLKGPMCLCVTPNQELIVSNHYSHTVSKYISDGTLVWNYGRKGSGRGELKRPIGVCVDPWGYIFVCDYDNDRIHYLSPDGDFLSLVNIGKKIECPHAIIFHNERLFITRNTTAGQGKMCVIKCKYN